MKLGLVTTCLPELTLSEIAAWASAHGYHALEVAAWPPGERRPFAATHIDATSFDRGDAERVGALLAEHRLTLSALAFYENNLDADAGARARTHEHLRACVEVASLLDVPFVGTFIGRDVTLTVRENLRLAERVFPQLVDYAGDRGVRLVIENCPMEGWHPDGYPGNLAYSPELWDWMFELGVYLNYDPSHLVWLGIDPVAALRGAGARVAHAQAKDVEIVSAERNRFGVFGKAVGRTNPWEARGYRYRVPGLGCVDWCSIVGELHRVGFDGVLSVEQEDPEWSGGAERVREGLTIAERTLGSLVAGDGGVGDG
jgi:sugar phosphate isomerase/epimerase